MINVSEQRIEKNSWVINHELQSDELFKWQNDILPRQLKMIFQK